MRRADVCIAGAGPAGLAAAYGLVQAGLRPAVFDAAPVVGGLARTEIYKGYRFDIGGHRFLTKVPEIEALWKQMLGDDLITVKRLSRIHYEGQYFDYPLNVANVLGNIGPGEAFLFLTSYLQSRWRPRPQDDTFEDWIVNRFGERMYERFFKTYTEKVWGIPCSQIRADWAAQRIRGLSFPTVARNAVFGGGQAKSLASEFLYPRLGPGQMWERFASVVTDRGGEVCLNTELLGVHIEASRLVGVTLGSQGRTWREPVASLISSMPLPHLVKRLDPPPPVEVREAAQGLRHRDFLIAVLIVRGRDLFPDNWIYVHSPKVRVGRVQNFRNWSVDMVPDRATSSLGMEYFCSRGDAVWTRNDEEILAIAGEEAGILGLTGGAPIVDGCVIRQPNAYPVYDAEYRARVEVIAAYLRSVHGLQTIGRSGMHRYNNQDHAMLTGLLAAQNVLGEAHDLWMVNTERSYYEEQQVSPPNAA
jgi:protoporphyrinogen oxidase